VFPPSDSNSLENTNDGFNGQGSPPLGDDRRGQDGLIPLGPTGLTANGAMPWAYGLPARPEILNASPNLTNLLHAFRRRKWIAIFLGLIVGCSLATAAWFLLPTRYEAIAWLQVHYLEPSIFHGEGGVDLDVYKHNAAELIKGPPVVNKALADRSIQDFPIIKKNAADLSTWLSNSLTVDLTRGELLPISIRADDPDGLPEIVNSVVTAFLKEVVDKERSDKLVRRDNLDRKFRAYKTQVLEKERQLYELQQQIGTTDAQTARVRYRMEVETLESMMRQRTDLMKSISDISMTMEMAKMKKDLAEKSEVPEDDIEAAVSRDPNIQQMMSERARLMSEQREIERTVKRKDDPSLVRIREGIATLDTNIQEVRNADRQQVIDNIRRGADQDGSQMKTLALQQKYYIDQYQKMLGAVETQADNVQKLEKFNGDADQLRAEIEQLNTVIRDMGSTLTHWNIELDAEPRVRAQITAATSTAIAPWRQYVVTGFVGILGFALAGFGVTFLEFLSRRLNSARDVAEGLGIRVMGDLPALRQRKIALRSRSRQAMHGLVAESINSIRATLIRNSQIGSSHVFMVTSAGEQEGKTTVASQLAASLARAGRRTLLIDGDLRHPGAHLVFGLTNEDGLCELLRGETTVDEVIRATPADSLWMVTAGHCCAMSVLALGKDVTADILSQLEARFEFIVIDTGPVLSVADPLLLGPHVDGAILSVLRDVSKIHKVYEAHERLKLAGVNVVGAVINGIEDRASFDRYTVEAPAA
jgi:succinoglycan biosynthesis transport protein ExoP